MTGITIKNILEATGGTLLCGDEFTPVENIALDSRTMKGRDIFVPIIGEKTDGHLYIDKAFENGAVATFTSEDIDVDGVHAYIKVDDTVDALQKFGAYLRDYLGIYIIGVTGSVGKTTTREMIALALSAKYKVTATKGNSNSQVGVPVTLSLLDETAEVAVVEMGVSKPGEMDKLADIVRPDLAVMTNVGYSHVEYMGSPMLTFEQKIRITKHFNDRNILVVNGDDALCNIASLCQKGSVAKYGINLPKNFNATNIKLDEMSSTFDFKAYDEIVPVKLSLPGEHNIYNACCALTIASILDIDLKEAAKKLEEYRGYEGRMNIDEVGGITVIDDAYNASPDSMSAALRVINNIKPGEGGRRIVVFGDIMELGTETERVHKNVAGKIKCSEPDIVYTVGGYAIRTAEILKSEGYEVHAFKTADGAADKIVDNLREGDVILFKASNSVGLGRIAKKIKEKFS